MANVYMPLQFAPSSLAQPILPNWSFNLFSVNLGTSSNAEIEPQVLEQVGSYGKQIGHLAEALEVVIQALPFLDAKDLSQEQRDALQVFLGDAAAVRKIKASHKTASWISQPDRTVARHEEMRPNPSTERTSTGRLRPPVAAAHDER